MRRPRKSSKFHIGDGLAQFEFALRQSSLVRNTEQIKVTNFSKSNSEIRIPKSEKNQINKRMPDYDPRRVKYNYYNDFIEKTKYNLDLSNNNDNITHKDQQKENQFAVHPPNSPYHYSPLTSKSKKSKTYNSSQHEQLGYNEYRNKKNKTSNIREQKTNDYIHPALSSFRAPEQLRELMATFSQLEYVVRDFLRNNKYYIQFAQKWKYFSDSFDRFIETASLHFSSNFNYNPESPVLYRQITKTTPVYLSSEIIVNNFSEFIQESKEIESNGSQLFLSIQNEFERIHKLIQKTRNSMAQNRYRTDIPCIKIEEFQNNVISLNDELFPKNFLNYHSKIQLNKKRLHIQICELNQEVFEIFNKHLKFSFMNLAAKIQLRTELSSCLSTIEESLLLAERIGTFVAEMKGCIQSTNRQLSKVLGQIGFQYDTEEPNEGEKANEEEEKNE